MKHQHGLWRHVTRHAPATTSWRRRADPSRLDNAFHGRSNGRSASVFPWISHHPLLGCWFGILSYFRVKKNRDIRWNVDDGFVQIRILFDIFGHQCWPRTPKYIWVWSTASIRGVWGPQNTKPEAVWQKGLNDSLDPVCQTTSLTSLL
jgi:hypothetical protein